MFCAISGQVPEEPVVSRTSGLLFEKRLILKALTATGGKCPETGEALSQDDLIDVRTSGKLSKPTVSTIGNIPNLLAHLQSEYDSITLEAHAVKKKLSKTRQELAHALYQFDAATRIIEVLTKEKNELENSLHKSYETKHHEQHAQVNQKSVKRKISLTVDSPAKKSKDSDDLDIEGDGEKKDDGDGEEIEMKVGEHRNAKRRKESHEFRISDVDKTQAATIGNGNGEPKSALKDSSLLADSVLVTINKQSELLLSERKTRKASSSLEKSSAVKAFTCTAKSSDHDTQPITSLTFLDSAAESVVAGSMDGTLTVLNAVTMKTEKILPKKLPDESGFSVLRRVPAADKNSIICGGNDGIVRVWDTSKDTIDTDGNDSSSIGNNGKVVDLGFHPNGNLLLTVLQDGKWRWTDINEVGKKLMGRASGNAAAKYASGSVHGDGILFATGCTNGTTEMWDIRTGKTLAQYKDAELNSNGDCGVTGLDMSENGYYLASAINGTVAIWDLRKHKILRQYESDGNGEMEVQIDYSGTYGAAVTGNKTVLFSTKRKSNILNSFDHDKNEGAKSYRPGLLWGENAKFVFSGHGDGCVHRYGSK